MVFVVDITAPLMARNREVADLAAKEKKSRKKASNGQSRKMGRKEREKMIASCGFLLDELRQRSKEEGATLADSVETLGVDLRRRVQ